MVVNSHCGRYEVRFTDLDETFRGLPSERYFITDENVARLYEANLSSERIIRIAPGEQSKCLDTAKQCLQTLAENGATRQTTVIAFGGGVVGDLAGLVAALFMRGIPLVQVPTTLLAQVDSSVGGKVGVDLPAGKNLAGAFYPPKEVRICLQTLATLDRRQFNNGMAEVWKYAFITDSDLFSYLGSSPTRDASDLNRLKPMVERCIEIKKKIVEDDEFEESGLRAILNFGHTIGHAIEAALGYDQLLHGEAISIGMVIEARIGEALGVTEEKTAEIIAACLESQGLPTRLPASIDCYRVLQFMARDKKRASNSFALSLLTHIGECKLMDGIARDDVEKVLHNL